MTWLTSLMDLVGSVFGWAGKRNDEYNTPEMKARQVEVAEVDAVNRVEKAIKQRDTESIRKELAE